MAKEYSVFISYRHKSADIAAAKRALTLLEAYRLPASLRDEGYEGVERVFRDTEELAVSRVLSNTIQEALQNSDSLMVVCSPDTPQSEWVDREVATFIELGRAERIYPLLIAGEPEISFPPSLKKVPDIAERVMDVRGSGGKLKSGMLLPVVAAVAGLSEPRLRRADRLRRTGRSVAMAVLSAAAVLTVMLVTAGLWLRAEDYRAATLQKQEAAMAVLSRLTYGLPAKLVELPSTYGAVAEILDENSNQIERILLLSEQTDGIREQIAANYEKHATASARLGAFDRAQESQNRAIGVYEALRDEGAAGSALSLASAYNNLGVIENAAGIFEAAAADYALALELLEREAGESPEKIASMAAFLSNSGANAMDMGDYDRAESTLLESMKLSADSGADMARLRYNLGICRMALGHYQQAEGDLSDAAEGYRQYYEAQPNRSNLRPYAQALVQLALCKSSQAKLDQAAELFPKAIGLCEKLASGQDDAAALSLLAKACNNYGLCLNMQGEYDNAEPWYLRYAEIQEQLYALSGTELSRASLARAYYNVAENAFKAGKYHMTRRYYDMCLSEYEPVHDKLGSYHSAEYYARLSYYHVIVSRDYPAALAAADTALALQPESSFVQIARVYALLFNGLYGECDTAAKEVVARSEGELLNISLDFAAMTAAGQHLPHMDELISLLGEQSEAGE